MRLAIRLWLIKVIFRNLSSRGILNADTTYFMLTPNERGNLSTLPFLGCGGGSRVYDR